MTTIGRLELSITSLAKFNDNIPYLAMGNARKLGFSSSADMFSRAYQNYDENMPSNVLAIHNASKTCVAFIKKYKIGFRDDILYILRHPVLENLNLIDHDMSANRKRRIFNFDPDTDDPNQIKACEYLHNLKPRERTGAASRIIEQYLIMSGNEYYFDQSAMRLYYYLTQISEFDDIGKANEETSRLTDLIWQMGK